MSQPITSTMLFCGQKANREKRENQVTAKRTGIQYGTQSKVAPVLYKFYILELESITKANSGI